MESPGVEKKLAPPPNGGGAGRPRSPRPSVSEKPAALRKESTGGQAPSGDTGSRGVTEGAGATGTTGKKDEPEKKRINLLLMGGTGVGKSTWINAFDNYCSFSTLDEAESAGGKFRISSNFEICHPTTGELVSISTEPSWPISPITDVAGIGLSVTRKPSDYVFKYDDTEICIIDTPGLLDVVAQDGSTSTSTHDRDNANLNNIFRLLWSYNEIHAICVVMTANQGILSDTFKYVHNEILSRLNTSANNNVIFFFTNAAGVNFQPGRTQAILQTFLKNHNLQIPLRSDFDPDKEADGKGNATIYCFENESVQYLAERINKIPLPRGFNKSLTDTNWSRSKKSTDKMIRYVCGLCPLPLADIKAIYDAQYATGILSELVLETLNCDAKNKSEFERKQEEAEKLKTKVTSNPAVISEFVPNVETTRVLHKPVPWRNVVCEGKKCVTFDKGEPVHRICCEACRSLFVYFCSGIGVSGKCRKCHCGINKHQWRKTKAVVIMDTVPLSDNGGQAADVDSKTAWKVLDAVTARITAQLVMYKEERRQMLRTCAILNTYVKQKVLLQSSAGDEMKKKLEYKIKTYQKAGLKSGVNKTLTTLQGILTDYNRCLQEVSETNITSTDDVRSVIEELYKNLPLNGDALKTAMEAEEEAKLGLRQETRGQIH